MSGFLIGFFTTVLVLASLFIVFVVLLQRGSEGGAGSAFGGGAAESAFGGETSKVLTRATVITAIVFFVVGLGLYLGQIAAHKQNKSSVALAKVVAQAQAKVDEDAAVQAKVKTAPAPGEATKEAIEVLEGEAKESAKTEESKPEVKQAVMINDTPIAPTAPSEKRK